MIVRLVKLTFEPDQVNAFLVLFSSIESKIKSFEGCHDLYLLRDLKESSVFFTYSVWNSTEDLDNYKESPFFKETWLKTKALFAAPAKAWSLDKMFKNNT